MNGQPVWLASLSRPNPITGERLPTTRWPDWGRSRGAALLRQVLDGLGDPARERLFRMQITLCLHRAATDAEVAALPEWFHAAPAVGLAGGPVEVIWESEPGALSTRPCLAPGRERLSRIDPDLWLPVECGECETCRARTRIEEGLVAD